MPYKSPIEEGRFVDRYGDEQVLHRRYGRLQVKRDALTPIVALNGELSGLIGQRVRRWRLERGLSLRELCLRAGIVSSTPKQRMHEIESATRRDGITLGTVYVLAMALDVEITALLPSVDEARAIADLQPVEVAAVRLVSGGVAG